MANWTFVTNHGAVLTLLSLKNKITAREIASHVGITERSVMRIISDLEYAGYINRRREGRTNLYRVNSHPTRSWDVDRDAAVKDLIRVLSVEKTSSGSD